MGLDSSEEQIGYHLKTYWLGRMGEALMSALSVQGPVPLN